MRLLRTTAPTALVVLLGGLAATAVAAGAQTVDRSRTVEGQAVWADGNGDCNTGGRNAQDPTGVGEAFTIGATITTDDRLVTIHWRIATGGAFMGPISGPVAPDDTFDLRGALPQFNDAWNYTGRLTDRQMVGTFVRRADYAGACTAQWKLTIDLARPLFAERAEETSPTSAGEPAAEESDSGLDWLPWAALLALPALVVWLVRQFGRRHEEPVGGWDPTQPIGGGSTEAGTPAGAQDQVTPGGTGDWPPPPPDTPPGDDDVVTQEDPCDCACTLTLSGPDRLYLCDCADPTWRLRPIAFHDLSPNDQAKWPESVSKAAVRDEFHMLEATVASGSRCPRNRSDVAIEDNVLFSRMYEAGITSTCAHGGQVSGVSRLWSLDTSGFRKGVESTVTVVVTATGTVTCPNGTHEMRCEARKSVSVRPDKCHVYVVINKHPTVSETGHAAVRIVCGEFDRIYGFFPGLDGVITVIPHLGEVTVKKKDGLQQHFDGIDDYYPAAKKWSFEIPVTCEQCAGVQDYWERLKANPGRYGLLNNNCTTQALESVKGLLPALPGDAGVLDKTPTISPAAAVTLLNTLGLKEAVTPPKVK